MNIINQRTFSCGWIYLLYLVMLWCRQYIIIIIIMYYVNSIVYVNDVWREFIFIILFTKP